MADDANSGSHEAHSGEATEPSEPAAAGAAPAAKRRPALTAVVIVAGVAVGWLVWSLLTPGVSYERSLPSMSLERLEGGQLQLASLTGEPVIVNMWATWCPPCVRELPMMARMAAREPGVHFLFADQGEKRDVVESYLAERPEMELQGVLLDSAQELAVEFETLGLPVTLFFDARGNHVHSHIGEVTEAELLNYVTELKRGTLNPL